MAVYLLEVTEEMFRMFERLAKETAQNKISETLDPFPGFDEYTRHAQKEVIKSAIAKNQFIQTRAARALGISVSSLRRHMQQLGIHIGTDTNVGRRFIEPSEFR